MKILFSILILAFIGFWILFGISLGAKVVDIIVEKLR